MTTPCADYDLAACFRIFAEQVAHVWEAIVPVLQGVYDDVYAVYLEAGAPYGENQDGLLRWMQERREIDRLRIEADWTERGHQDMIEWLELTRKIAQRRAG